MIRGQEKDGPLHQEKAHLILVLLVDRKLHKGEKEVYLIKMEANGDMTIMDINQTMTPIGIIKL